MDQTIYRFSIKQEVLLEKSAETLGEVAAYYRDHSGENENVEPWKSIYEHLWSAKQSILLAKNDQDLYYIEGKFDLIRNVLRTLNNANEK